MRAHACETGKAIALAAMVAAATDSFGITATKAYVDKATNMVLVTAKEYADSLDFSTAEAATNYTDKVASETLKDANGYADEKATDASKSANEYTDTKSGEAVTTAKSYADGKAAEAVTFANSYTDTKAGEAVTAAKGYTDGVAEGLVPNTRKVNGHTLDEDVNLTYEDVNAVGKDADIDLKGDHSVYNALEVTVDGDITSKATVTTGALTVKDGEVNFESSTNVKLDGGVYFTGTGDVDVLSGTFTANDVIAGDAKFSKLSYSTGVVIEGQVVYDDVKERFSAVDTRITGVSDSLESHKGATNNPHGVTAEQVGAYTTLEADSKFIPSTAKGAKSGVATLDSAGIVPSAQLPSYVDDVLEFDSREAFPTTGESGKIYVAIDTNLTYRWGGTEYVEISPSLALGETESTAYAGNKGKANAEAIAALQASVAGKASQTDLDTEVERAKAAEKANADDMAALKTTVATKADSSDLTAETERAKKAEESNTTAISSEVARAQKAEKANADEISSLKNEVEKKADSSDLATEKAARESADTANSTAIANEVTRATGAEKALQVNIDKKADASSLSEVATSGKYTDLTETPTKVSSFDNDSGYITSAAISATDPTFSAEVQAAAKALVKDKLAALDPANSSIRETIAALQSIYETETQTEE